MTRENEFADSLERSGAAALEWAQKYYDKMMAIMGRELGSTEVSTGQELLDYARVRHDPALLRQAFLEPLRQRHGKGRGNELFVDYVKKMEANLLPPDGTKGY